MVQLMAPLLSLPSFLLLFSSLSFWWQLGANAQKASSLDSVKNFCSRWESSSIVKNGTLFINGGIETFNESKTIITGVNTYFLKIPLTSSWDWKTNITINQEPKNESNPSTGTYPPSLIRGTMFQGPANQSNVYTYGGTTFMGNTSFDAYVPPDASTYPLWSYDYATSNYPWDQFDISQLWMPNHGAATEAADQGLAFYLNGQIDEGTSTKTLSMKNDTVYTPLNGMLVINLVSQTSVNISTDSITGNAPRVGGSMEYVKPVGRKGVLVAIGGQIAPTGVQSANISGGSLLPLSTVDVFDIHSYLQNPSSNGTWYSQDTEGDTPEARIDFCLTTMSAPDNSSHHIYLYGGYDPTIGKMYDDVWMLSMPAFRWTKVYSAGNSPRWGHKCHVVNKRQIVTVGGNITGTGIKCDWEKKGVAFLDLSDITWGSIFNASASSYTVPKAVLPFIGGNETGGATVTKPATKGWTNPGLGTVFSEKREEDDPVPAPTTSAGSSKNGTTNGGAIAGGVIGGVAALAILGGLLFWLRRRRQRKNQPHELPGEGAGELEGDNEEKKEQYAELGGKHYHEMGGEAPVELPTPHGLSEASPDTMTYAAELPATNVVQGGRPGIPHIRTPSNEYLPFAADVKEKEGDPPPPFSQ